jgi:hypothetical protein
VVRQPQRSSRPRLRSARPNELISKLRVLIPELLDLNNVAFDRESPIDIHLHFFREGRITLTVAA